MMGLFKFVSFPRQLIGSAAQYDQPTEGYSYFEMIGAYNSVTT